MATLPYVVSPGNIDKALTGIKSAAVPEKVSQDFVKTILKITGSSGDQMTSFLKKLGLANPDGSPNDIYKRFRNPPSSGAAIASAIKYAYAPLYKRNEFMHELSDADLLGLIIEETGLSHDAPAAKLTASCIKHLKAFADFNTKSEQQRIALAKPEGEEAIRPPPAPPQTDTGRSLGLNLGYTINLNLPATADPEVFDAIFKSLKEHLLRNDDG